MSLEAVLPLFIFALVSSITPGGATTMSAASGANFGFRRSIPLMAGIAAGLASMAAAAALGLAGVLIAMPSLQIVLKAGGSAYLLWLAWKVGRAGRQVSTLRWRGQPVLPTEFGCCGSTPKPGR